MNSVLCLSSGHTPHSGYRRPTEPSVDTIHWPVLLLEARKNGNTAIEQAVWLYPEAVEQET